mmetsp:Transcript_17528/g.35903  ORF Transcript_17528/g.35903 Transcript_17528/m.35903 type:complete len:432 (+) Transcript_17528:553-1848(+)
MLVLLLESFTASSRTFFTWTFFFSHSSCRFPSSSSAFFLSARSSFSCTCAWLAAFFSSCTAPRSCSASASRSVTRCNSPAASSSFALACAAASSSCKRRASTSSLDPPPLGPPSAPSPASFPLLVADCAAWDRSVAFSASKDWTASAASASAACTASIRFERSLSIAERRCSAAFELCAASRPLAWASTSCCFMLLSSPSLFCSCSAFSASSLAIASCSATLPCSAESIPFLYCSTSARLRSTILFASSRARFKVSSASWAFPCHVSLSAVAVARSAARNSFDTSASSFAARRPSASAAFVSAASSLSLSAVTSAVSAATCAVGPEALAGSLFKLRPDPPAAAVPAAFRAASSSRRCSALSASVASVCFALRASMTCFASRRILASSSSFFASSETRSVPPGDLLLALRRLFSFRMALLLVVTSCSLSWYV